MVHMFLVDNFTPLNNRNAKNIIYFDSRMCFLLVDQKWLHEMIKILLDKEDISIIHVN